jgi:hypothetical protein
VGRKGRVGDEREKKKWMVDGSNKNQDRLKILVVLV